MKKLVCATLTLMTLTLGSLSAQELDSAKDPWSLRVTGGLWSGLVSDPSSGGIDATALLYLARVGGGAEVLYDLNDQWSVGADLTGGVITLGWINFLDRRVHAVARWSDGEHWAQYFAGWNYGYAWGHDTGADPGESGAYGGPHLDGPELGAQWGFGNGYLELEAALLESGYFIPSLRFGWGWKTDNLLSKGPRPVAEAAETVEPAPEPPRPYSWSMSLGGLAQGKLGGSVIDIRGYEGPLLGISRVGLETTLLRHWDAYALGIQVGASGSPYFAFNYLGVYFGGAYAGNVDFSSRLVARATLGPVGLQPFYGYLQHGNGFKWAYNYAGPEVGLRMNFGSWFVEASQVTTRGIYYYHLGENYHWWRVGLGTQLLDSLKL